MCFLSPAISQRNLCFFSEAISGQKLSGVGDAWCACATPFISFTFYQIEKVTRKKVEKQKVETHILKGPCTKHPLQNRWGLWFYKNDKSKMWQDNLRLITKFDTAEDFWDGIEPMWEDRSNKCGGRWLITLAKQHRRTELDHFWLETLLCLIGEGFGSFSRDICGSVINIRAKGDKIAIWTSNAENCETVTYIGHNICIEYCRKRRYLKLNADV
uniref:Eukaryotic translation initiation factor 4E family member 1B n=1 Tax=Sinocyclocheilus grahami TaxID=75366 RepID=A0A672PYN8_SINGR